MLLIECVPYRVGFWALGCNPPFGRKNAWSLGEASSGNRVRRTLRVAAVCDARPAGRRSERGCCATERPTSPGPSPASCGAREGDAHRGGRARTRSRSGSCRSSDRTAGELLPKAQPRDTRADNPSDATRELTTRTSAGRLARLSDHGHADARPGPRATRPAPVAALAPKPAGSPDADGQVAGVGRDPHVDRLLACVRGGRSPAQPRPARAGHGGLHRVEAERAVALGAVSPESDPRGRRRPTPAMAGRLPVSPDGTRRT